MQKGDFAEAARTYHGCVDLMNQIPGNQPVAFRMPCCDSLNTVSPRFFAEIFNKTSPGGHFLSIDSSVFTVLTPDDPSLPRELVFDPDGKERFRKYIPFPSFVNTIENYPYPYVIGRLCWEFPCIVPSDWEGQSLQKPNNPKTLEDLKAALDCVVLKQGVFNLVFHPHGWIKSEQVVELIDHAVKKHGKKVKFLNFKEAQERLNKNLLGGQVVARAEGQRQRHQARFDPYDDGQLEVVSVDRPGAPEPRPDQATLPAGARYVDDQGRDAGLRFVDLDEDGHARCRLLERSGIWDLPIRAERETLDAQGHGGQGRNGWRTPQDRRATAPTTASSSIRDISGGKTKTPPSSPTWSIAARSMNC